MEKATKTLISMEGDYRLNIGWVLKVEHRDRKRERPMR